LITNGAVATLVTMTVPLLDITRIPPVDVDAGVVADVSRRLPSGALAALFGVGITTDDVVGVRVVVLAATAGVGNVEAAVGVGAAAVAATVEGAATKFVAPMSPPVMYELASELIEPLIVLSGFAVSDGGTNCPVRIASGGVCCGPSAPIWPKTRTR
jgi:hypothetical protein